MQPLRNIPLALGIGGILFGIAVGAAVPVHAQAENDASASIDVTATVVESLGIVGTNNLSFGEIVSSESGTSKEVDKASPEAGQFEVTGAANQPIQISFRTPTQLVRTQGTGAMDVDLALYGAPTTGSAGSAEQVFPNDVVSLMDGRYFFFVAGSLTARGVSSNPPGTYTAEFELTVSYAGI